MSLEDIEKEARELRKLVTPTLKANVFNLAAPGASVNILREAVAPGKSPSICRVEVLLGTAAVFKARISRGGTTFDAKLNAGVALIASGLYIFDISWQAGDRLNFQVETDGVIQQLMAHEIAGNI